MCVFEGQMVLIYDYELTHIFDDLDISCKKIGRKNSPVPTVLYLSKCAKVLAQHLQIPSLEHILHDSKAN